MPLVVVGPVGPREVQGVLDIALPVVEPPIALLQKLGLVLHRDMALGYYLHPSDPHALQQGDTGYQGCTARNSPSAQSVVPAQQRPLFLLLHPGQAEHSRDEGAKGAGGSWLCLGPCSLEEKFLSQHQPWGQRSARQTLLRDPLKEDQKGPGKLSPSTAALGQRRETGQGPCGDSLSARPCAQPPGTSVQHP